MRATRPTLSLWERAPPKTAGEGLRCVDCKVAIPHPPRFAGYFSRREKERALRSQ